MNTPSKTSHLLTALAVLALGTTAASAADITLKASDAAGTSSFTGATNWSNDAVPSPGNDYFTTNAAGVALQMRTPIGAGNHTFQGDSLTVFNNGGDALVLKGDTGVTITVTNLVLAGGTVANGANAGGAATTETLAGNITVISPSRLSAVGSGRVINVTADLFGSAALTNSGQGTIFLGGNNSGFTGKLVALNVTNVINDEVRLGGNPGAFAADQFQILNSTLLATNSFAIDDSNRGLTVTNAIVDVSSGATLTLATPVTGLGGTTFIKRNAGTLVLSATNALAGTVFLDRGADGASLNDGGVRITTSGALAGATNISIRNTSVTAGGSRLELDGTGGGITVTQSLVWSGRNNVTPAFQNIAGNNFLSPASVTLNAGGAAFPIRSDADTLTLTGTWPTSASGTRNFIFQGGANTVVSGVIASAGATIGVVKTNAGTLTLSGNNTYSAGTTIAAGTLNMAHASALGSGAVTFIGTDNPILNIATDGADTAYNVNAGSSTTWTISSDVKTGSLGVNHTLGNFSIGSGATPLQMNVVRGPNVTGGSPRITMGTLTLSGGGGGTTILNPTTADLTIGGVTSVSSSKTLQLDGTATGNQITGVITNGANVVTLTKAGPGTWTLSGVNTYTGNTTLSNGVLALSGSGAITGSPLITINSGATFDVSAASFTLGGSQTFIGNGTVSGTFTTSAGSQIVPGFSNAVGRLTFNNTLALAGGDTVRFDFATGTNDIVAVGNLSPSGVTTINLATLPPGGLPSASYTLFEVSGTLGGSAANFAITGAPSPSRQSFNIVYDTVSSPKRVLLQVTGAPAEVVWRGSGSVWDIATTLNWTNITASALDYYFDGDNAVFTDFGSAISPVLNVTVQPTTTTFNSANNYSLTGAGKISGSGTVTKAGGGTLIVATANDYTGATVVNGGTLSIATVANGGAASPIGAASSAPANLALNGGKLQYTGTTASTDRGATLNTGGGVVEITDGGATVTLGGSIVGTNGGALSKQGGGTLILSGANTYDGATTISAGTLQIGAGGATGSPGAGAIVNNAALVVDRSGTLTIATNISGSGTLTKNGNGTLVLAATNTYAGATTINTGIVQVLTPKSLGATPASFNAAQINIVNGELEVGVSHVLNDVNTGITVEAGRIGVDAGVTFVVSNQVTSTTSLTKSRPGTLVLSGNNSLAGTLFVDTGNASGADDGALRITSQAALGSVPDIQIRNQQSTTISTLQLDGTGGGITIDQTFSWAGRNNYIPAIENIAGNNTFNPSVVNMTVGGSLYPIFATAGTLTLPGTYPTASPTAARSFVFGGNGHVLVTGSISAASSTGLGVIKTNAGTLTLTDNFHTYNGVSSFQEGTVNINNVSSIGVTTANVELAPYTNQVVVVNLTNSTLNALRVILAGISANNTTPGTATLNQYGGAINSAQWFTVGSGGTGGGTGTYNLTDGTLTVQSQQLEVGNFTGASGTVNLRGFSTLNIWNNGYLTLGANANAGPGTFNHHDGTVTLYSDAGGNPGGTGFLMLGRAGGLTNTYTYRLNGGTLHVPAISSISGNSLFYFNGGTLRASRTNAAFMGNLTAAYVSTNGAVIDDNNFPITITQSLLHDPALSVTADGGLTKQGFSALTLAGTNTYTGPTVVNGGALNVNGSIGAGSVNVQSGALSGNGLVNVPVTVQPGAVISPGAPLGLLTAGSSVALEGGSAALFNFGPGTNSSLTVAGALNINGPATVNFGFINVVPAVGTYTLVRYGSISGYANLSIGTSNPRYGFVLTNDTTAKEIKVIVSGIPAALVWRGDGSFNAWDNAGGYQNWRNGGSPDFFFDGDVATFDNTGSNTPAIYLLNTVSPGSIAVNSTKDYTFGGTGGITGPGGLTKSGAGTLTLEVNNNYTGPTVVNAGTLQVGNGGTTGSLGTGALTNNGTLAFNRSDVVTYTNDINGAGTVSSLGLGGTLTLSGSVSASTVTLPGSGVLALTASNNITGVVVASSGSLRPRNALALGTSAAGTIATNGGQVYIDANISLADEPFTFGGAALRKGAGGVTALGGPLTLVENSTFHVDGGATLNLTNAAGISGVGYSLTLNGDGGSSGTITGPLNLGAGTVTKGGGGTWTLAPTNNHEGVTTVNAGLLRITGDRSFGVPPVSPNPGQVTLNAGEIAATTNITLNNLNSGITVGTGTIGVESGATLTITSPISVSGALTKSRPGTLILSGNNSLGVTLYVDTASQTGSDGALRITTLNAIGGVSDIQIRNNQGPGSSTLQLDGSGGSLDLTQTFTWSGRNNFVPAIENFAGNNTWNPSSVTLNVGGSFYPINSAAGTLTIPATFPTTAPAAPRNLAFGGAGDINVTGVIQDGGSVISVVKTNTGLLTLANANTYINATTIQGGTLRLTGSITSTGGVFVVGGVLDGTGTINDNVTVGPAGTLSPGTSIGTLTVNGNLNLGGKTAIEVNKTAGTRDRVLGVNQITYGGTLAATNLAGSLVVGDSFQIFSAGAVAGNFTSIIGSPGPGLAWSFTPASGTLSVVTGVASYPTNLSAVVSGGSLNLSWPGTHLGWILQSQTNSRSVGLNTNWFDVAGTSAVTNHSATINPTNPTVFFRLRYP